MRAALKVGLVVAPFALVFFALRACRDGEAERWRDRVAEFDPAARVAVAEDDLIVIAPDKTRGAAVAAAVRGFRKSVVAEYGDLLGEPPNLRMVVVVFTEGDQLRRFAGRRMRHRGPNPELGGYTDPQEGAIFVPEVSVATLRHETIHWVVGTARRNRANPSPWLSEGLAQLFETYEPGKAPPGIAPVARFFLRDGLDVDRLIGLHEYGRFTGAEVIRNYTEALVLTAFLFERDRAKLAAYIREDAGGPEGEALFRRRFRPHEEAFRRDLRAFVDRLRRR